MAEQEQGPDSARVRGGLNCRRGFQERLDLANRILSRFSRPRMTPTYTGYKPVLLQKIIRPAHAFAIMIEKSAFKHMGRPYEFERITLAKT